MPRSKQRAAGTYDLLAAAAAHLRSDGHKQRHIAELLHVSQPEVCRLLQHAEEKRFFDPNPRFIPTPEGVKLWTEAKSTLLRFPEIGDRLESWAPDGIRCQTHVIHADEARAFGRAVAEQIGKIIIDDADVKTVGVLWGKTLNQVAEGVAAQYAGNPPRRKNPLTFVPLCGEPLYQENLMNFASSASSLAAVLAKAANGKTDPKDPSLGVPAYISLKKYRDGNGDGTLDRFAIIKQSIHDIHGHKQIFGEHGLMEGMQAILSGVGVVHNKEDYTGTFLRERVAQGDTTKKELSRLVLGDIGGVLIPRPGLPEPDQKRVKELNEGLTGIQYDHFRTVARGGAPGVIVVAAGAAKADIVRQIVTEGLANVLVINLELAAALSKL